MTETIIPLTDHYYNKENMLDAIDEVTQSISSEQSSNNNSFSELISQFQDIAESIDDRITETVNYMSFCMEN